MYVFAESYRRAAKSLIPTYLAVKFSMGVLRPN